MARMHVLVYQETAGKLFHAIQQDDLSWTPFTDILAQDALGLKNIWDCSSSIDANGVLHVCINVGGEILHATYDGKWTNFQSVSAATGQTGIALLSAGIDRIRIACVK